MTGTVLDRPECDAPATELAASFDVQITVAGRAVLARVHGPLDLHFAPRFLNLIDSYQRNYRQVVVDLRSAEYVDSSGVRALLLLHRNLQEAHSELRVVIQPGSRVERVIRLLKLENHFNTFTSLTDAWGRNTQLERTAPRR